MRILLYRAFHNVCMYCTEHICFSIITVKVKVRVKQSRYSPGVAQRVPEVKVPNFMTTAQDGGKVVSLMHRPPLPTGNTPGTHFF